MTATNRKQLNEERTLKSFLQSKGYEFQRPVSIHEPDGWTIVDGHRIGLELTRYYADMQSKGGSPQRAAISEWNQLWKIMTERRKMHSDLRHVKGFVEFKPHQWPSQGIRETLADEVIRISEAGWNERNAQRALPCMKPEPVNVVFIEDRSNMTANFQDGDTATIDIDRRVFPLITQHVREIRLSKHSELWPEWWGQDMRGGSPNYDANIIKRLIEEKVDRLHNRRRGESPVWLIVLCDLFDDVCTHIYPRADDEYRWIISLFETCGYNFDDCPFQKIWLMSECRGHSFCVASFTHSTSSA